MKRFYSIGEARELACYLMQGARPVPTQLFYRGLYPIGGVKMEEALRRTPWPFKKWGFLAADPPVPKGFSRVYLFDPTVRRHLLRELASERPIFRLRDYLRVVRNSISRQQALKDVATTPWITRRGRGKGMIYIAGTK